MLDWNKRRFVMTIDDTEPSKKETSMSTPDFSRRDLLLQGSVGLALLHAPWLVQALPSRPGEEIVPWLDQPGANPSGGVVENLQPWENLASSFITPNDKFFRVSHYDKPVIDEQKWRSEER